MVHSVCQITLLGLVSWTRSPPRGGSSMLTSAAIVSKPAGYLTKDLGCPWGVQTCTQVHKDTTVALLISTSTMAGKHLQQVRGTSVVISLALGALSSWTTTLT